MTTNTAPPSPPPLFSSSSSTHQQPPLAVLTKLFAQRPLTSLAIGLGIGFLLARLLGDDTP